MDFVAHSAWGGLRDCGHLVPPRQTTRHLKNHWQDRLFMALSRQRRFSHTVFARNVGRDSNPDPRRRDGIAIPSYGSKAVGGFSGTMPRMSNRVTLFERDYDYD